MLAKAYPGNKKLQDYLKDVRKNRPSTFGRFVSDPSFRGRLGLKMTRRRIAVPDAFQRLRMNGEDLAGLP